MKTNEFEHVYVISLRDRTDRRDQFYSSINKTGFTWNVETFNAIDGKKTGYPKSFEKIGSGAFGCWESHRTILTHAANEDWPNVLIFEDDAVFVDGFTEKLAESLAELPDDWDQLYLGFQPWNVADNKLMVLSEHIWRVGDANRTHAYAVNRRGYQTILKHLGEAEEKPTGYHIDHWFGVLHRKLDANGKHVFNAYACRPQLVAQAAGPSDISGKNNQLYLWKVLPDMEINKKIAGAVTLEETTVGYGEIGRNGHLGYEGKRVNDVDKEIDYISAHASSRLFLSCDANVEVFAFCNSSARPHVPIKVTVDGASVGEIFHAGDKSDTVVLARGRHVLGLETEDNRAAHTVWGFRKLADPVLEILSNSTCSRNCPGCNQRPFMEDNVFYEYDETNARKLIEALEKNNKYVRVCFTGGEPGLWTKVEEVMAVFAKSNRITGNWVVTSDPSEENISRLKGVFGRVFLSERNDTADIVKSRPTWLEGVTVWDQREHAVAEGSPAAESVDCCCADQGIVAAIIGDSVYPCIVAESIRLAGGDALARLTIAEYFAKGFDQPIGTYKACLTCVNNLKFRRTARKEKT